MKRLLGETDDCDIDDKNMDFYMKQTGKQGRNQMGKQSGNHMGKQEGKQSRKQERKLLRNQGLHLV